MNVYGFADVVESQKRVGDLKGMTSALAVKTIIPTIGSN